jgi:predicted metal-dependent HD superfamily phosphohydrolase
MTFFPHARLCSSGEYISRRKQFTTLASRWSSLWLRLGARRAPELQPLSDRYCEPHRFYHTMYHVRFCLRNYDAGPVIVDRVELALWLHDAIYDTHAHDNEQQSADWCKRMAEAVGLPSEQLTTVIACILATQHKSLPSTIAEQLTVSIDLSILATSTARFQVYDRAIRQEYAWVPLADYRRVRARVLTAFLTRPHLFPHPWCEKRWGQRARFNLRQTLARLRNISLI